MEYEFLHSSIEKDNIILPNSDKRFTYLDTVCVELILQDLAISRSAGALPTVR